jgi:hypothetical protein
MLLKNKTVIVPVDDLDEELEVWSPLLHLQAKQARRSSAAGRSELNQDPAIRRLRKNGNAQDDSN